MLGKRECEEPEAPEEAAQRNPRTSLVAKVSLRRNTTCWRGAEARRILKKILSDKADTKGLVHIDENLTEYMNERLRVFRSIECEY